MALAERFMQLFAGLDRAYGTYEIPEANKNVEEGEKVQGKALTVHAPVTATLWEAHLTGKKGIGIVPITDSSKIVWAGIDIDVYPLDIDALEQKCNALNLPLVLCKTKSGGVHALLFMQEPTAAKLVRHKLMEWAIAIGHPGVEVFPKQNSLANKQDVGNWLNMPYFAASGGETKRYCYYNGQALKTQQFLELAESRKVSTAALTAFTLASVNDGSDFEDGPPCLQHLSRVGFPRGGRNMALFNIGVFARMVDGDDWKDKLDTYNRELMDPPLSTSEVMNTIKSVQRKTYFYTCDKEPIAGVCNKEICKQRKFGIGQNSEGSVAPVMLGCLTKINSDPPMWIIDVEGYRMEVTTDDLMNQQRFRKLCMEKINKFPPMIKQPIWEAAVRERLANVEIIEAPSDSSPEGQFMLHLEEFCTSRVTANTRDELILGKPFTDPETQLTYFRSMDFIKYLDQQHFREFDEKKIWSLFHKLGAGHKQFQIKGKCVMTWFLPAFAKQNAEFELPEIQHDEM